jgi:hypothetical protein
MDTQNVSIFYYVIARRVFFPTKQSPRDEEIASGTPALAGGARENKITLAMT